MKRILTALSFILISYASFGQGGKFPITVSGSGGGGGTSGGRYTTNDFGTLVDSATINVYKIIVDTTVIASQARLSTMLALKLNISDTASMLLGYQTAINNKVSSSNFIFNEQFTGSTSSTYTLANTPIAGKLTVYKNGVELPSSEFSLSGAIVTLTSPRVTTDIISNNYIK